MERRATLRRTLQESVDHFQKKLDEGHNLVDYFLTIGLDPEISLKPWLYEASINQLNTTYKEYLSPKIINKFPSFEKKLIGIDEAIINHIFPLGFNLIEILNEPPKEQIFSILLDNNMYSIKHPVKFVTCLLFYEPLTNYYKIFEKYHDINIAFSSLKNNSNNNLINISNFLDNNSNGHFILNDNMSTYSTNTIYLGQIINNNSDLKNNIQPVFKGSNLKSSDMSQKETNISSIINTNNLNNNNIYNSKIKNFERYYVPKCICLVSLYPFITEFKTILNEIYKYSKEENIKIPLEKIINNLVLEVPVPPRGLYSIEYNILQTNLLLKNSRINSLFYISFDFELLFAKFNIKQILTIFQYLLLGIKTIFFSSEIQYLTPIILSSLVLLFPFKYPFPIGSITPRESYNLIDNITPELLGINEKYYPEFFIQNDISISNNLLVVNIDERKLEHLSPKNNNNKNKKGKYNIPALPKKITEKLYKKLEHYFSKIHLEYIKKEQNKFFEKTIRNYFLEYLAELLKNYPKYLNNNIYPNPKENPYDKIFDNKRFLKSVDSDDLEFYKEFIETQMFKDYILKRMIPNDKSEITDVLFLEEKIFEIKGQKEKIMYINSDVFNFKNNKPYQVNRVNPDLKENILEFYSNEQNRKKLLLEGIIINNNYNLNDISILKSQNNALIEFKSLSFNYLLFPKLNNDFFFKNEVKSYFLNDALYDEIKVLNDELISKSHLNRVETQTNEITNYIYLLWLKVWANTFHYHDKKEQKYRYIQMMKIFKKINQHDMSILSHLFQALIKSNANEDLIYHLYIKIIQSKLSPSLEIFNTIKTMIKNNLKINLMPSSIDITKFLENKIKIRYTKDEIDIKNFRQRTMKNIYDYFSITEKVTFDIDEICSNNNCRKKINIYDFLKNLNNTSNNPLMWAKCPFCNTEYFPKIKIIFGSEINKNNKLKNSTSLVDIVPLYSPKILHMNVLDYSSIDVDKYKLNYNQFFWNLILYFKLIGLPYDFMLPYTENIFRPKKPLNNKHNSFIVNFSNTNDFINANNNNNILNNKSNGNEINNKMKKMNIIKNKQLKMNNNINVQKPIINNNQYNTIVHKIDNENQNRSINMSNRVIKLTPKLDNNNNNINLDYSRINNCLSPPSVNLKQIRPFNSSNNLLRNHNNILTPNLAYNYKIIIPTNNYNPVSVINSQIYFPKPTLNNYNYYNNTNVLRTSNNYANYMNNNIVYNTINNYSTVNSNINNNYLNKRIIVPNPINYIKFITYNK